MKPMVELAESEASNRSAEPVVPDLDSRPREQRHLHALLRTRRQVEGQLAYLDLRELGRADLSVVKEHVKFISNSNTYDILDAESESFIPAAA